MVLKTATGDKFGETVTAERKLRKKPEFQSRFLFLKIFDEHGNPAQNLKLEVLGGGPVLPKGSDFVKLSRQAHSPGGYEIEITRNNA